MEFLLLLSIWTLCGFIAWGGAMADFNWSNRAIKDSTPRDNVGIAFIVALAGPLGLLVTLAGSNFFQRGWSLWSPKDHSQKAKP